MKPSSPRAPLSPARARNCALLNQFATPGLGSLMAGRVFAGAGQLGIFLVGFVLFLIWFVGVVRHFYSLMFTDAEPHPRHWLAFAGISWCAVAWLWSLVTSLSIIREGRRNERDGKLVAP